MRYDDFYRITDKLNRNKYHLCCKIHEDMLHCDWYIYRKDMPLDKYFSPENKAVLSSDVNTKKDLINFCKFNKA